MSINKKLKLLGKKLIFLSTSLFLSVFLSNGLAYAIPSTYQASGVIGQPDFTSSGYSAGPDQFEYPNATAIDTVHHRLFVADLYNYRVVVYQLSDTNQYENNDASYVLGAQDLNTSGYDSVSQNGFDEGPAAL